MRARAEATARIVEAAFPGQGVTIAITKERLGPQGAQVEQRRLFYSRADVTVPEGGREPFRDVAEGRHLAGLSADHVPGISKVFGVEVTHRFRPGGTSRSPWAPNPGMTVGEMPSQEEDDLGRPGGARVRLAPSVPAMAEPKVAAGPRRPPRTSRPKAPRSRRSLPHGEQALVPFPHSPGRPHPGALTQHATGEGT